MSGYRYPLHVVGALLAVSVLALSCTPRSDEVPPEPSQRALAETLRVHKQDFDYIRSVANQRPRITAIVDPDQPVDGETPSGHIPVSDKRIAALRRTMDRLHVVWFDNDDGRATFTMWLGPPSWKDRVSKGIVYSSRAMAPIYGSVDSPARDKVRPPGRIYARIKPDWYIFWDWG